MSRLTSGPERVRLELMGAMVSKGVTGSNFVGATEKPAFSAWTFILGRRDGKRLLGRAVPRV